MSVRGHLSEDAEREETESRTQFRMAEGRLRQLRTQHSTLLETLRRIDSNQKTAYDRRLPLESRLEVLHHDHRVLGRRAVELRAQRDQTRRRAEEALVRLRVARTDRRPEDRITPQQLRREIARLEIQQQTVALKLSEENELIAQIRELTRRLADVEKRQNEVAQQAADLKRLEEEWMALRAEADRIGAEAQSARVARDEKMDAMRAVLVEVGQLVAESRTLARSRDETVAQLENFDRQIHTIEREMDQIMAQTRARRVEARETLREFSPRRRPSEKTVLESEADAQLQELMRRGKVTLRG